MKREEISKILDLCRARNVAGIEVGPDTLKVSFFPELAVPERLHPPEPEEPAPAAPADPDVTMRALMAQDGR